MPKSFLGETFEHLGKMLTVTFKLAFFAAIVVLVILYGPWSNWEKKNDLRNKAVDIINKYNIEFSSNAPPRPQAETASINDAVKMLEDALKLYPNDPHCLASLGRAKALLRDFEGSEKLYRQVLAIDDSNAQNHMGLGFALFCQEHFSEARAQFERAAGIDHDENSFLWVGWAYERLDDGARAREAFGHAIDINEKSAAAHRALGESLVQDKLFDDAIPELRKATEYDPNNPEAFTWLGNAYFERAHYADAILACQHASTLNPKDTQCLYWMGRAYLEQQKYADALRTFQKAHDLEPNDSAIESYLNSTRKKLEE